MLLPQALHTIQVVRKHQVREAFDSSTTVGASFAFVKLPNHLRMKIEMPYHHPNDQCNFSVKLSEKILPTSDEMIIFQINEVLTKVISESVH